MDALKKYVPAALWVILFQIISAAIGQVTSPNMDGWYDGLEKSSLNPPSIVFPIVWTSLYVLIALAGWRIWRVRDYPKARFVLVVYVSYVVLNWAWSFIFFQFHLLNTAFFWILLINVFNLTFIYKAWRVDRLAACFMIPPLIWTSFAAFLNYEIWMLNS